MYDNTKKNFNELISKLLVSEDTVKSTDELFLLMDTHASKLFTDYLNHTIDVPKVVNGLKLFSNEVSKKIENEEVIYDPRNVYLLKSLLKTLAKYEHLNMQKLMGCITTNVASFEKKLEGYLDILKELGGIQKLEEELKKESSKPLSKTQCTAKKNKYDTHSGSKNDFEKFKSKSKCTENIINIQISTSNENTTSGTPLLVAVDVNENFQELGEDLSKIITDALAAHSI